MNLGFRSLYLMAALSLGHAANAATQESLGELVRQGTALSEKGNYAAAVSALKRARELAPRDYTVNLLLGQDLLRSGQPKEAIEPLRVASEVRPQDGTAEGYLGKALAAVNEFAQAAEAFELSVTRSPGSDGLWTQWADFGLERYRVLQLELRSSQSGMAVVLRLQAEGLHSGPETREELLRLSAAADPEQPGIWGELGMEQLRSGMRAQAAATLKAAQAKQPHASLTLQLEAMAAAAQGDWREANAYLLELGSRSPATLRRALGSWPKQFSPKGDVPGEVWDCIRKGPRGCIERLSSRSGEAPKGEEELFAEGRWEKLAALPKPPKEAPPAWFRRGVALAELNACERAIPALERGLEPGAETAAFWLDLCYASEAERATQSIGLLKSQVAFHRLRGDFLVRVKDDAQAATEEYRKARSLSPRDAGLAERLAQAYMSLGDVQRAKEAAREALALDPHRIVTLRLLASIAMNERDYPGALEFLNKMLVLRPSDAWTRVQTGIAYAQTGQAEQALSYLQPMLAAGYPDERGALHATLAGVLRKLGREQEAQRAAEEASRLSDSFQQHAQKSADDHP